MNKYLPFALAPLALVAATAFAQQIGGAADVEAKLRAAGYAEIRDVEFDSGLWEADVRRADGRWGDIAVDPATGEVFDARDGRTVLDVRGVTDALAAAGYTEVSDLDRDGALWEAEARDAQGQRVELRISGIDGRILHSDIEHDD
ncbi:PepSY domain-containing protein [Chiayiivirga flava]|uniref:PepSY domain-containing protein n=1 Tax=Chiayiivirga flava TaxID=659595 RepID=A0A7W8DA58_9GAMM|nr:PepSY domain-containing protein [Chiayiivirga flava]MBB5209386.1 hypothetical protein [Chiayiivirga flava]